MCLRTKWKQVVAGIKWTVSYLPNHLCVQNKVKSTQITQTLILYDFYILELNYSLKNLEFISSIPNKKSGKNHDID